MLVSTLQTSKGKNLIIQLGSGLIGTAISKLLTPKSSDIQIHKVDWSNVKATSEWLNKLQISPSRHDRVEIIWAAGKAGFSATEQDITLETENFEYLVNVLANITTHLPTRFWLMSSAGGLHEGQTCVNSQENINPSRPYADLKLHQEVITQKHFQQSVICRISSVYTTSNLSGRLGLIPVLMKNGIQNKVSTLVGSESTLRDYVLDSDIGNYVYKHILAQSDIEGVQYLVNGAPVSIRTIKGNIEQIILKKLYIKYAPVRQNSANISFLKSLKSETFQSSSMLSNIKILYNSILSYA